MRQGSEMLKFYVIVIGQIFNCHLNFVERLKKRLQIHEVNSEEESDFILAFVSIVSRVGTDIEFALPRFPTAQPVLLVVLHHTFEEQYMAPDSQIHVRHMSNVFAVDCLFHEDKGLLPCLRNEQALKAITDHLINTGASSNLLPQKNQKKYQKCLIYCMIGFIITAIVVVVSVYFLTKN
ncbi:uncharacterized protein LOC143512024 isoform X2 [Brachyhypopomus gauderio]|uniref:uncharacterized protein LOC143512024 isoform X2 n=1 Tax=Brachyhypopomus gauderio TaxID=698409 RepID=UPI004041A58B